MTVIEKPEQRWYSIEEGSPLLGHFVQVAVKNGDVTFGYRSVALSGQWLRVSDDVSIRVTHWRPKARPPKQTRPDCKHYEECNVCDLEHHCMRRWETLGYPPCEYGADWCKYEAKKTTRPDCKHWRDGDWCFYKPETIGFPPCQHGADWCRYEAKEKQFDLDRLQQQVNLFCERVEQLRKGHDWLTKYIFARFAELEMLAGDAKDGD